MVRGRRKFRRVGDKGKAIAMVGWGHLCLPFCAAAKWSCARLRIGASGRGRTQVGGSAPAEHLRPAQLRRASPKSREEYHRGGGLSSIIINGLGIRSNGGKVKTRSLKKRRLRHPAVFILV